MNKTFVISLGGSLIVPDKLNRRYLRLFSSLIKKYVSMGYRFIIICGGGATSRQYMQTARQLGVRTPAELDWIGIAGTQLNAELVRAQFGTLAHPTVVSEYRRLPKTHKPVLIGGGWKPGRSTDYDAVLAAQHIGAGMIINLSDIRYVYDKDPDRFKNAQKLTQLRWRDYMRIVGPYTPGGSYPFDPVAARQAQAEGISAIICSGKNIANIKAIIAGKRFSGTIIQP